jgi:hypothetical protein
VVRLVGRHRPTAGQLISSKHDACGWSGDGFSASTPHRVLSTARGRIESSYSGACQQGSAFWANGSHECPGLAGAAAGRALACRRVARAAAPDGSHGPKPVAVIRWARVIAQPCGAALLGALVGAAVVAVWAQTLAAQRQSCQHAGGLCFGPDLGGIALGVLVAVIVSAAGLAALRVRPLLASVPAALALGWLTVIAMDRAVPGGQPPPVWLAASLLAAGYAAVCVAVTAAGQARLAALAVLAMMIVASIAIPPAVHDAVDRAHRQAAIRALGFQPLVPHVPGYKIADAYPVGGTLAVDMVAANSRRDQFGAYEHIAFTVTISTPAYQDLDFRLRRCQVSGAGNHPGAGPCHALSQAVWEIRPASGSPASAISVHGRIIAFAQPASQPVPIAALAMAVTDLHRISASQLLALE